MPLNAKATVKRVKRKLFSKCELGKFWKIEIRVKENSKDCKAAKLRYARIKSGGGGVMDLP